MSEKPEAKKRVSARDVLRVLFRYRGLFAIGVALFSIPALVAMPHLPQFKKKYTGTAIFEQRTDVSTRSPRNEPGSFEETLKPTLEHDLIGRKAVETAIEELGLTKGLPHSADGQLTREGQMAKQKLVMRIREQVKIRQDVNTQNVNLISVSFTDKDPKLAQNLPNTLVRNYITRTSDKIVQSLSDSRDFLQKQVDDAAKKLSAAMKIRSDFEVENGGFLPDNPSALQEKMQELSSDIDSVRRQNTVAKQKLAQLQALAKQQSDNANAPLQVIMEPNPEIDRLRLIMNEREKELSELEQQWEEMRIVNRMTEKHPAMKAQKGKIDKVKAEIAQLLDQIAKLQETEPMVAAQEVYGRKEQDPGFAAALASAKAEAEMTDSELARLQRRLDMVQNLLGNLGSVRQRYLELVRATQDAQIEKDKWQQRLQDIEMALSAEVAKRRTHLNAAQLAQEQFVPSDPKLSTMLGLALVGGVVFGGGLVFLANLRDRSVGDPRDAEALFGLPVYGVIGEIVPPATRAWRNARRFAIEPAVGLLLLAGIGIATLNVILWLQYPAEYERWTATPLAYLGELAGNAWHLVRQKF